MFKQPPERPPFTGVQELADISSLLRRMRDARLSHPDISEEGKRWYDQYYTPKITAIEGAMARLGR